jgi:hypothetical protein
MMLCGSYRVQQIICFIFLRVLRFAVGIGVDPLKAFFGSLAFGFSTYLIIILGVGHNAKAHAMPICLSLCRFYIGFQEEVHSRRFSYDVCDSPRNGANHFQMTYYLLIFLLILSGYFIYQDIKER